MRAVLDETALGRLRRIVELELRVDGHEELPLLVVEESPLQANERVPEAALRRFAVASLEKPRKLELDLNPIANAVIEVEQRRFKYALADEAFVRRGDVHLQDAVARRCRIVGAHRRPALSHQRRRDAEQKQRANESHTSSHLPTTIFNDRRATMV